jgi:4-hydroxybenzoate polyprenyltransferase
MQVFLVSGSWAYLDARSSSKILITSSVTTKEVTRFSPRAIPHLIRVRQWAKNALIFAGFVFAGRLREAGINLWPEALRVLLAFVCFCALSGIAYVINDWADLARDRLHPVKKFRPLASGQISKRGAVLILVVLAIIALASGVLIRLSSSVPNGFVAAAAAYFALTLAYSFFLKHEVIIDVLCVAIGFVLRVVAGCLAVPVKISPWIIFCTFTLALFIGLCKRRAELHELGEQSAATRKVLLHYSTEMLDILIAVSAGLTIIAYSFYTFTARHADALGRVYGSTPLLMMTIPFVIYGVFRYLFLAISSSVGGEPEQMLRDKKLMANLALWALLIVALTLLEKF